MTADALALLEQLREAMTASRPWSRDDLLTETDTLARLGVRRDEARAWLQEHVRARQIAGRRRYRWGDVLDASDPACATPATRARPAPRVPRGIVPVD